MKKSQTLPQTPESDYEGTQRQSIVIPSKHITIANSFEKKEHSWYNYNCIIELARNPFLSLKIYTILLLEKIQAKIYFFCRTFNNNRFVHLHILFNCFSSLSLFILVNSCRFITSHVPTDLTIQVQDVTFNVHKVTTKQDKHTQ